MPSYPPYGADGTSLTVPPVWGMVDPVSWTVPTGETVFDL